MTRAERAAQWVLKNEGEWSDHPSDRGGRTKFGITEATARRHGLQVEDVTEADAVRIFVEDYWRFDRIKSDVVATKLFDIAVNCGTVSAVIMLQRALRILGRTEVKVDGRLGRFTLTAANATRDWVLLAALTYLQMDKYVGLAEKDPTQQVFLGGWLARANREVSL
jgi:lysozyme family protein